MKKILLAIVFCVAGGLILFQGVAGAVTTDVPSGTIITAEGYENYIDYKDAALNVKATIYGTTIEAVVLSIYGLSLPSPPADQYTEPAVAVWYIYQIYNEGNIRSAIASLPSGPITGTFLGSIFSSIN